MVLRPVLLDHRAAHLLRGRDHDIRAGLPRRRHLRGAVLRLDRRPRARPRARRPPRRDRRRRHRPLLLRRLHARQPRHPTTPARSSASRPPARPSRSGSRRASAWSAIAMLGWDAFLHAAFLDYGSGSLAEVIIAFTAVANAGLFALNIIPAFPLDGGRILRAIVWRLTGDRHRATTFSAYLGQGFAGLMMLYGVYRLVQRARHAGRPVVARARLDARRRGPRGDRPEQLPEPPGRDHRGRHHGLRAGDDPGRGHACRSRYEDFFLRYQGWPWFAVVETDGHFAGLAHRAAIEQLAREGQGALTLRDVVADVAQVTTDTPLEVLVGSESLSSLGALMAVDAEGRLRGVVTREQVSRACRRDSLPPSRRYCAGHARARRVDHRCRSRRSAGRLGGGASGRDGGDHEQGPPGPIAFQCGGRRYQRRPEPRRLLGIARVRHGQGVRLPR